jgi:hypothetical protein
MITPSRFLFPCMHKKQCFVHGLSHYLRIQIEMSSSSKKKQSISFFFIDDHTRVQLINDEDGDYINASKIVSLIKHRKKETNIYSDFIRRIQIQNANILQHKVQCQIQQMHFGKWYGNKDHVLLLH